MQPNASGPAAQGRHQAAIADQRRSRRWWAAVAAAAVATGGLWAYGWRESRSPQIALVDYQGFEDCDALLSELQDRALNTGTDEYRDLIRGGGWGGIGIAEPLIATTNSAASATPEAAPDMAQELSAGSDTGSDAESGADSGLDSVLNEQVAGVSEAATVVRSGSLIAQSTKGQARIYQVQGPDLIQQSRVAFPSDYGPALRRLLIHGTTLYAISTPRERMLDDSARRGFDRPEWFQDLPDGPSDIDVYDLSNPGSPQHLKTMTLQGFVSAARLVDGSLRLVIAHNARLDADFSQVWEVESDRRRRGVARRIWRDAVKATTIEDWLGSYTVTTPGGQPSEPQLISECSNVGLPENDDAMRTMHVMTLAPEYATNGVDVQDTIASAAITAHDGTVYVSANNVYIASSQWADDWRQAGRMRTSVHRFDVSDETPTYVASGSVPGTLLNQFSLDEYEDHLRVATTTTNDRGRTGEVNILATEGSQLNAVGTASNLGVNEDIKSVRFIGPQGYVVTFRQTDPLFTLGLSDPKNPRVLGELKIPGYSAYLHPWSDDEILGIGVSATAEGQVTGFQTSVFDVSIPQDPKQTDVLDVPNAESGIATDHHQFTRVADQFILPMRQWVSNQRSGEEYEEVLHYRLLTAQIQDGQFAQDRILPLYAPSYPISAPQQTMVVDGTLHVFSTERIWSFDSTGNSLGTLELE